jgi:hypothetical protein
MATAAAKASASAQPSTLAGTGASNASGKARTGTVWRKMLWMANQIARFQHHTYDRRRERGKGRIEARISAQFLMNGAPRKIHRKQGVNVTEVASKPPSVPASIGESSLGSRNAATDPTNYHDQWAGRRFGHPEPISISPGLSQ